MRIKSRNRTMAAMCFALNRSAIVSSTGAG